MLETLMSEIAKKIDSPLLEKAKGLEKITDTKELDKPITDYVSDKNDKGNNESGLEQSHQRNAEGESESAELQDEKPIENDIDVEKDPENGDEEEKSDSSEKDSTSERNDGNNEVEYNEEGTRELTEDEKQYLKDKLGWSDDKLKKCTIDENGVIHFKTDRCDLEGKTSENGVLYERRTIEINGVKIEGVFPVFDSAFNTRLDPDNYKTKFYAKECNAKLKEAIQNDPELRSKFTEEQIEDIAAGRTPRGYVWHHNEEPGKIQLVKREDHDRAIGGAAHTGGNSLWGADSIDKNRKGEDF